MEFSMFPIYRRRRAFGEQEESNKLMLRGARATLIENLSFYTEPYFRQRLLETINSWLNQEISYEKAREDLNFTLQQRGFFPSLLPSSGIQQLLRSFGFFSISKKLGEGRLPAVGFGLPFITTRLGIIRNTGIRKAFQIFKDMRSIRRGSGDRWRQSSLDWIFDGYTEQDAFPKKSKLLIMAPGPTGSIPDFSKYDKVMTLLTPNTKPRSLQTALEKCETVVLLNGEMSDFILKGEDSEWKELLGQCSAVFAKPKQVSALKNLLGGNILPSHNRLVDLFGSTGNPNLAQWGTGLALRLFGPTVKITIAGANLYAGKRGYQKPSNRDKNHPDFYTCIGTVGHDPVPNFTIMKKLMHGGFLEGDEQFFEVLSLPIDDYLMRLDQSLGKERA